MSIIYLGDARLRKYSFSGGAGGKSVVKIELDVSDPYDLSDLLRQFGEIERGQKAAAKPPPPVKKQPLGLPAPPLQLPFYNRGDE